LKRGDKGSDVWALQKILVYKQYEIPIDGIFSEETERAVKELQQASDHYPSGIVDEALLRVMIKP
jgi:peptidoglycan hydrolase-like protein with peptidoglycan-binding domain